MTAAWHVHSNSDKTYKRAQPATSAMLATTNHTKRACPPHYRSTITHCARLPPLNYARLPPTWRRQPTPRRLQHRTSSWCHHSGVAPTRHVGCRTTRDQPKCAQASRRSYRPNQCDTHDTTCRTLRTPSSGRCRPVHACVNQRGGCHEAWAWPASGRGESVPGVGVGVFAGVRMRVGMGM